MARKSTASSQPEKLTRVSVAAMRKPLTKSQLREIEALIQKPDSEIDYSDIPESVGDIYKPIKRPISLRLDADVLEWLKSKPGYQTRINQLLREAMLAKNRKNAGLR